ncbi:hypothetical protein, partial [Buttiauxella sp.]|uniref:hypothetical protein n=1 Tax=Buttiauxella sp. TaxID=1972222 RepID=UPI003C73CA01
DEEQLIKLMNENGFTEKEVGKLLLTAEKYPATLEWVVGEFARYFKSFVGTLLIASAIFCIPFFSGDSDVIVKLFLLIIYLVLILVSCKAHGFIYLIKCHRVMKVIKQKYKEAERDE